jgi:hypothetical protein
MTAGRSYQLPKFCSVNTDQRLVSCFLDPILSELSFPLPGIERQPAGATRYRISLPIAPVSFELIGSDFLA